MLTLESDSSAAKNCSDVVPCSHWVKMSEMSATDSSIQTCTDYCKHVSSDGATCVNSWLASGDGSDPAEYCKPTGRTACDTSYSDDQTTPVVCVCAKVATCTLFTKCDKSSNVYNKLSLYTDNEGNQGIGFSIDPRMHYQNIGLIMVALTTCVES